MHGWVDERYRLDELLKTGLGTETWKAHDASTGQAVVLKRAPRLPPARALDLQRQARLESPHVRRITDWSHEGEVSWWVAPFLEGPTLREAVRPALPELLSWARSLLEGLEALHALGLLHRDVKPENVILTEGRPVLIDPGPPGGGTVRYMPPEQSGLVTYDVGPHSDLYALAVLLTECLSGEDLASEDPAAALRRQLTVRPPVRGVPRAVADWLARLGHPDPRRRYRQAQAARLDLERILQALEREPDPLVTLGLSDHRSSLTEPSFVDRHRERALLMVELERLGQGEDGLAVWLIAASGAGKTRLLDELALEASRRRLRVVRGGADPGRRPYAALEGLLAEAEADGLGPWAEVLAVLRGDRLSTSPQGPEAFGEERTELACRALLQSLGRPEQPVLILIDDLQWADAPVARALARGPYRHALVVAASRSEPPGECDLRLELPPLQAGDVEELARSMAGSLPKPVCQLVQESSEGNPWAAVETLRGLVEGGGLAFRDDRWFWRAEAVPQLSRRGASYVEGRLEALPPDTLRILTLGAVLGRSFPRELLAELAAQPLDASLEDARERQLLWLQQDTVRFSHDRLRDSLLERLPAEERRRLHARCAELLAAREPRDCRAIALHLGAAELYREALDDALRAGSEARSQYAWGPAAELYRLATRGARTPAERLESWEGLGLTLDLQGSYKEAIEALQRALEATGGDRLRLYLRLASVNWHAHENETAVGWFREALAELGLFLPQRPSEVPRAAGQLLRLLVRPERRQVEALRESVDGMTHCLFITERRLAALYTQLLNFATMRGAGSLNLSLAAVVAAYLGARPLAVFLARRALRQARHDDPYNQGRAASRCASALFMAGELRLAAEAGELALRGLETSGDEWEMGAWRVFSAWRWQAQGRHEEVPELLRVPGRDPLNRVARLWALARQHAVAEEEFESVTAEESFLKAMLLAVRGKARQARGDLRGALAALEEAGTHSFGLFVFEAVWHRWELAEARYALAITLPAGREREELLRRTRSDARWVAGRAGRYPVCAPQVLRLQARLAAESGQPARALRLSEEAARKAARLGMPAEQRQAEVLALELRSPPPTREEAPVQTLAQADRQAQVLAAGARLALAPTREELVGDLVETTRNLLRADQVLWLEPQGDDWRLVQACPPDRAEWSTQLVEKARQEGLARLLAQPESLSDSLLLSDIRSALCVDVRGEGVLYCLHRGVASLFGEEDERTARYLASLSGAGFTNLQRRLASEEARRERAESESLLASLFAEAEVAMAVTAVDGGLVATNRSWEERLGSRSPEDAVLPSDRPRLREGEAVRFLRQDGQVRVGHPRRHPLEEGHVLTTLSDVSLDRVTELLEFLEAERHWLAVELHDGPAQVLAAARLGQSDPLLEAALDELLECMRWLSSPTLESEPLSRLPADVNGTTSATGTLLASLYRVLQDVLDGCGETARVELSDRQAQVASADCALPPELREMVELRCELAGLSLHWTGEGVRITW